MLRTNLATRPFYNERAVRVVLGAAAVVVVLLTLFNAVQLVRLSGSESQLGASAGNAEREADRLRSDAARMRTQINPKELETVATAAREANSIIDQRAFSWTELFGQFEATLPPDVRIKAVQPRQDKGVFYVALIAQARRSEDLADFMEALEATHAFSNVKPLSENLNADGLLEGVIEGVYSAPQRTPEPAAATAPAAPPAAGTKVRR